MKITHIHSYLVHPEKGSTEPTPIRGAEIPQEGSMFKMLRSIFDTALNECKYDVSFVPEDDISQFNNCRQLIINYMKEPSLISGLDLANQLRSVTTRRSGLGLFFLIFGQNKDVKRIVLSRFPADAGILAEEDKSQLSVKFVERIFMKNSHAYKSAVYEGASFDTGFWTGKAIDKQITTDIAISAYWIKEFLKSDFAVTGERGTRTFALAIKNAVNSTQDLSVKRELIASSQLIQGYNGKLTSISEFADYHGLSEEAKVTIKGQLNHKQYSEHFIFLMDEFEKHLKYKTVELDNGAFLTAKVDKFDSVFSHKKLNKKIESFMTEGVVISEKIRKSLQ